MSLAHAANLGRHSIAERKDDLYETPPEAVRALLESRKPAGIRLGAGCGQASDNDCFATIAQPSLAHLGSRSATIKPVPRRRVICDRWHKFSRWLIH